MTAVEVNLIIKKIVDTLVEKYHPDKIVLYNVSDLMGLRKKIICHNYDLRSPQKQV